MNMKKVLACLLILAMVFVMIPVTAFAADLSGATSIDKTDTGLNSAKAIASADDLKNMTETGSYILTNDITISGEWSYIYFSGTLNGANHTIYLADGVQLNAGLFHQLGRNKGANAVETTTTVKDLKIVQLGEVKFINEEGDNQRDIGFLAGRAYGNVTIDNVSVKGNLMNLPASNAHVGGLIGNMRNGNFTVTNCVSDVTFPTTGNCANNAGGIIGSISDNEVLDAAHATLSISNCVTYGSVYGKNSAGGILGTGQQDKNPFYSLTIQYCVNYASVSSIGNDGCWGEQSGGIVGYLCYYNNASGNSSATAPKPEKLVILNNVNFGEVVSRYESVQAPGGIVGNLKIWSATPNMTISGNVNNVVISGSKAGSIVANAYGGASHKDKAQPEVGDVWKDSTDTVKVENNYSVAGVANSKAPLPTTTPTIDENTLTALNTAYENTYAMDGGKISLKWAVEAGHSYMKPVLLGYQTNTEEGIHSYRFATAADQDIATYGDSIGYTIVVTLTKKDDSTTVTKTIDKNCSCVYTSFQNGDTEYKVDGEYYALLTVTGISDTEYSAVEFTVTPKLVLNGTTVTGASATYSITLE